MRLKCLRPWLIFFAVVVAQADKTNDTFKVYRVFPQQMAHIGLLDSMELDNKDVVLDFWHKTKTPGEFSDIMISSRYEPWFPQYLANNNIPFNVTVPDVQALIIQKEKRKKDDKPRMRRTLNQPLYDQDYEVVGKTKAEFRFGEYSSYASMVRYLRTLEFYYPQLVRLIRIGTSHEGRPIEGVKIGFAVSNITKRAVWIDGNIHAREWASSHTALFIINQLVSNYGVDKRITDYLNTLNFYIVPCLNPDGYEYSRSSVLPQIRLWRKNRSPERCMPTQWGGIRCCQGVDLNRNFDFHWAETGSSDNPCSNLYAGEYAFSEPESHAVATFLQSNNLKGKLDVFVTLHTYAQFWIHPYSHIRKQYPKDLDNILEVAEKATKRLKQIYGTEYQVGTGADLLSPAAGGSDDWAKEKLGVKYVYLLELRPQNNMKNGFILDRTELLPVGIETLEGLKVVFDTVLQSTTTHKSFNVAVNNTLDIRKITPATTTTTTSYPFSFNPRVTQYNIYNTFYVTRRPFYTTPMTTTITTTTTSTTTSSSSTSAFSTLTTKTTTKLSTTSILATSRATTKSSTTTTTTSPATTKSDVMNTTMRTKTIDLVENLPFETRKQLSEELLRKQLMRIKNLVMINITTPQTSTTTQKSTIKDTTTTTIVTITVATTPPTTTIGSTSKIDSTNSVTSQATTVSTPEPKTTQISAVTVTSTTRPDTATTKCVDKKYSCAFWINADKKACRTQRRFMETNCAFSCGYCTLD
ncbi:unnamed protein product [Bursaphelenchus okinawaensis]|uniref:ShKT domain-containing protein n=1 Tax=Bursaphelenchus okinawaensis TaxID=465554 RepID=A0A811JTP6_9BILA|nr:unnamed protein product [Bursaphelenchus okinawaensis]CAG9082015.1 unnamed protein product [Bursaphelenchus okinawaensis]